VALLAKARELVNTQLKAPEGMQQVGDGWCTWGRGMQLACGWGLRCSCCARACHEQASARASAGNLFMC
jgi:hypothetical protein